MIGSCLVRIGVLEAIASQEIEVQAVLGFCRVRGLQELVPKVLLRRRAAYDCECFVLCVEDGTKTGGPLRSAQLELVDAGEVEILRDSPCGRIPIIVLAAGRRAEQRGFVAPDETVENVGALEVESRNQERPLCADSLGAGAGGQAAVVHRGEFRSLGNGELCCVELKTRQILIFVRVAGARGVGERTECADAGQVRAGVVAAAMVVMLKQIAVGWIARCVEKSERC